MNTEIAVQKMKDHNVLKLGGELRFNSALSLEKALKSIDSQQALYFDMENVKLLDSTIIGTMIKFLLEQNQIDHSFKKRTFFLSLDPGMSKMLTQIGFEQFVNMNKVDKQAGTEVSMETRFEPYSNDKEKLESAVLEAHQLLSKIDPTDNNFKNVIDVIKSHREQ